MPRLIVNADDFGLTVGVNRAIAEACADGIVTSTTLMANSAAFADALHTANDFPANSRNLSIGCHVVLVDGDALSAPSQIPSLVTNGARFRQGVGDLGLAAQLGRVSAHEIEREASAQFARLLGANVSISHFDAHKHAHMFPAVLRPLLRAARAAGIRAVRNPFEPATLPLKLIRRFGLWKRYAQVSLLRSMRASFLGAVREAGLATTDGSIGVIATGDLDRELLAALLEHLPEGTWELVCHPGYNDAELDGVRTRLRESRETELSALKNAAIREVICRRKIELISFADL